MASGFDLEIPAKPNTRYNFVVEYSAESEQYVLNKLFGFRTGVWYEHNGLPLFIESIWIDRNKREIEYTVKTGESATLWWQYVIGAVIIGALVIVGISQANITVKRFTELTKQNPILATGLGLIPILIIAALVYFLFLRRPASAG